MLFTETNEEFKNQGSSPQGILSLYITKMDTVLMAELSNCWQDHQLGQGDHVSVDKSTDDHTRPTVIPVGGNRALNWSSDRPGSPDATYKNR